MTKVPPFQIIITPPDTAGNFMDFNRECEELDSDFLMQPINEAEYDSETQACVDTATGGPSSFYEHFTTKRKKKKHLRGPVEAPVSKLRAKQQERDQLHRAPEEGAAAIGSDVHAATAALASLPRQDVAGPSQHLTVPQAAVVGFPHAGLHPVQPDHLFVVGEGSGIPKHSLQNVYVRRVACGRMPPPSFDELSENPSHAPSGPTNLKIRFFPASDRVGAGEQPRSSTEAQQPAPRSYEEALGSHLQRDVNISSASPSAASREGDDG